MGNVQGTGLICHTMVVVLLIICLLLDRYWYHNGYLFPDMGTVFIAIDKCDRENGCLKVRVGLTQRRWLTPPTNHSQLVYTVQHCGHVRKVQFLNLILMHNYVELCIVERHSILTRGRHECVCETKESYQSDLDSA